MHNNDGRRTLSTEKLPNTNLVTTGPTATQSSMVKLFLAGSLSGTISCILFQPLDLLKTKLQMMSPSMAFDKSVSKQIILKQSGILHTMYNILRTESFFGLWKGLVPSLYRTVPGVGMYFCTLNLMKGFSSAEPNFYENLMLGFTSRAFVGGFLLPVTVVKSRFESGQFNYTSVTQALRIVWQLEGFRGLYSGFSATIARDAPFSGLYLMFYGEGKKIASKFLIDKPGPKIHFTCGIVAGFLASVVTHPADVTKTQLQLYPSKYHNTIHCVMTIYSEHGTRGFLRGLMPRCLRRTLISALSWTVFEELMQRLDLKI